VLSFGTHVGSGALGAVVVVLVQACSAPSMTDYVDPFIGTGAHGHTYPGATVPFGMVQLSPDNGQSGWDWVSGYHYSDSVIVGFSHTHLSGTGIGDLGDVLFMPVTTPIELGKRYGQRDDRDFRSGFSHERETASPGYYSVFLEGPRVQAELTATARVGVHRYTYPASTASGIILDLGYAVNWDTPTETVVEVEGDSAIVGHRFSRGWATDQRVYFVAKLSKPFTRFVLADDSMEVGSRRRVEGTAAKGLFNFVTADGEAVVLKVGISYVDLEGARRNVETEVPDWDFDRIRDEARAAWETSLGRVRVKGGSESQRRTFYTALYRTKLAPIRFGDVDGRYRGGDGNVHAAEDFEHYSIFSLWDTFRAAHPLYTILEPERVSDMVKSMLAFSREYGLLPVWSLVGNETNTMTGYHAIPVIADAYLKGIRDYDVLEALEAMVRSANQSHRGLELYRELGYVPSDLEPESVTKTLEYAFDDWAIAELASALGRGSAYRTFADRAQSYRRVFDAETGFMRGRMADGDWVEPFDPLRSSHRVNTDYTEGNAWQHSWFVPHDVAELIQLMGGEDAFIAKLDSLFASDTMLTGDDISPDISGLIGQYAHGNEPSHHIAYLYSFAGAPWKTQEIVRRILRELYDDSPTGLSGNEDCGQMSAWYVFSAMGFYPVNPVGGVYVLGSPLFDQVTIELDNGAEFVIRARGSSSQRRYVQSVELNGVSYPFGYVMHSDVVSGGSLTMEMAAEPNTSRAVAPALRPPSGLSVDRRTLARRAVQAFQHAWEGYKAFAWGHDELRPLTQGYRDWHAASLVMTPLDAFDTMVLMGLDDEAREAKRLVLDSLTFEHDFSVQVFEITIRVLGGLISAYQLDGDARFLELATDLGDRLLPAFASPTGMPFVRVNLQSGDTEWQVNNPAEIGTLMLEFGALSKLTGNPVYYDTAKRAIRVLFERRSAIGLVGTTIDVESGEWQNTDSHVSGMIDSYYEYLLKAWLLFDDGDFAEMWRTSVPAVHRYLADEHEGQLWYGHADMWSGRRTSTQFGALDAFLPAVLALAGDTVRAARLMNSVFDMWTAFDIEPEQFDYVTRDIVYPPYFLRPEALESAYYLHRLTGDPQYLRVGKVMFESIVAHTQYEVGFTALDDVVTKVRADAMESFFLAETLKYAFLLFADSNVVDVKDAVFNTEAHPIWRTWD
jgi:predicted alpha-1,2-mannosidase